MKQTNYLTWMLLFMILPSALAFHSNDASDDHSQVNFQELDYTTLDYSDPMLYKDPTFYQHLPSGQYSNLNYALVAYQHIDHDKVDSEKYLADVGCDQCTLSKEGSIEYSSTGISASNNFVTLKKYPRGTLFVADEQGITVVLSSVHPDTEEPTWVYISNFVVPDTDTMQVDIEAPFPDPPPQLNFQGTVLFDKGAMYVTEGNVVHAHGFSIRNPQLTALDIELGLGVPEDSPVQLFLNGNKPDDSAENYVYLDPAAKKFDVHRSTNAKNKLSIRPRNKLLSNLVFYYEPHQNQHSLLSLDTSNLLPTLTYQSLSADSKALAEDGSGFSVQNGKIITHATGFVDVDFDFENSNVLELAILGTDGKSSIGWPLESNSLLFNDKAQIATYNPDVTELGRYQDPFIWGRNAKTTRIHATFAPYTTEAFEKEFGIPVTANLRYEFSQFRDPLGKLAKIMRSLPPNIRTSIQGFELFTDQEWVEENERLFGHSHHSDGYTHESDSIVRMPFRNINTKVTYHEGAHDYTYIIEDQIVDAGSTFKELWTNIAKGHKVPRDEPVYGQNLILVDGSASVTWEDGTRGAKNGFVESYGAKNFREDVATYMEYSDPAFFKPLITPGSPQYDPRYKQKLYLAWQYGFITRDRYYHLIGVKDPFRQELASS